MFLKFQTKKKWMVNEVVRDRKNKKNYSLVINVKWNLSNETYQ